MTYLRNKTIAGRRYVYLCESKRTGDRVVQRTIASLGPLDGAGRPTKTAIKDVCHGSLPINSLVQFTYEIQGELRLFKGVTSYYGVYTALVHYPLWGEVREMQLPWERIELLPTVLPLAGKGKERSRRQGVLL